MVVAHRRPQWPSLAEAVYIDWMEVYETAARVWTGRRVELDPVAESQVAVAWKELLLDCVAVLLTLAGEVFSAVRAVDSAWT